MNDVSILVWNLIIGFFDFLLIRRLCKCAGCFDTFYEEVYYYICTFFENLACFVLVVVRAFLYTGYIAGIVMLEECSVLQFFEVALSWIPFVVTTISFIWSICILPELFQRDSYVHSRYKTFCSIKTIKLISAFSDISYDYSDFYYLSRNYEKTVLCFSPLVYIFMCFSAYTNNKTQYKKEQKEKQNGKEKELYKILISDLQNIQKENEAESMGYFDKVKKNLEKLSR